MFTKLIDALKATRRTIVFTEGPDARILEAADRLVKDDLMNVILIGNVDEVKAAAEKGGFDIAKAEIIDPATYAGMDEMVAKMVELRKGKMSEEDCRKALAKGNYFGTMPYLKSMTVRTESATITQSPVPKPSGTYRLKSKRCSTKTMGSCRVASSSAIYWA